MQTISQILFKREDTCILIDLLETKSEENNCSPLTRVSHDAELHVADGTNSALLWNNI